MADLTIDTAQVALVEIIESETLPVAGPINAGDAVRINATGKAEQASAAASATADVIGVAITGSAAGTITVVRKGVVDLGAGALSGVAIDGVIYLSDTAGGLSDAPGTVSTIVGTVIPAWGTDPADKLLRIDL